ncbi:MAG: RNA polymerase sigma factor [Pseudomonadota bacterium]
MARPDSIIASETRRRRDVVDLPSEPISAEETKTVISALYSRFYSKLVDGLRRTYGAGPPDPEDVAQAAFARLGLKSNLEEVKDLEGYVWITARNMILTEKRREATRARNKGEVESRFFGSTCNELEPERVLIAKEEVSILQSALDQLSTRRRTLFLLHRVQGLSVAETARQCGVSRTAAVRHIALATRHLQTALETANRRGEEVR